MRSLAVVTLVLAAAASAAAYDLARRDDRRADASSAFQRLTGGLGFGPALDLAGCPAAFDPRADTECPDHFEPLPCGDVLCRWLGAPLGESHLR